MPETKYPNVLLVTVDQWPGSLLGCGGHPAILTPTLDQLARNGVYYPNAYSECPVCVPARRTLLTGLTPYEHNLLENGPSPMPPDPTIADLFRAHGYQCYAVGKMHVMPQRRRLGFDDILLDEEGRSRQGVLVVDDYEMFLAEHGHPGERFGGGMCNNEYLWRPWHLDERLHPTNWAVAQMCRTIKRRDPLRPAFWYLSFSAPHPPQSPPRDYLEIYRNLEIPPPVTGDWIEQPNAPWKVREYLAKRVMPPPSVVTEMRRAFYAACTHIDHQFRLVLGTLREEGLLDDTIVCFTADHGDMLGNHRMWAKQQMYQDSNRVPMLLMGTQAQMLSATVGHARRDERLVGLRDVMPTLLSLAGIEARAPRANGLPMTGERRHDHLFGCFGRGVFAARMVRDERYKLIYYPTGNRRQLFDLAEDPNELHDLADQPGARKTVERLTALLMEELDAEDRAAWAPKGGLEGCPEPAESPHVPNRNFSGQRGLQYPPPAHHP